VDLEERADPTLFHSTVDAILKEDANASLALLSMALSCLACSDPTEVQRALSNMAGCGCFDETFHSLADGARVSLPSCAAMSRQLEQRSQRAKRSWQNGTEPARLCGCAVRAWFIDAVLGNKDDAIREGERAVELTPVSKNAIEGATLVRYMAIIYAWTDQKDRAIERLAETTHLPAAISATAYVRLHPLWTHTRRNFRRCVGHRSPDAYCASESTMPKAGSPRNGPKAG